MSYLIPNAQRVAEKRYLKRDENGNLTEDWAGLCKRVVDHVCVNETKEYKDQIFDLILHTKFIPNSPCLVNAGNSISGLLACHVSPAPEDTWNSMCENIKRFGDVARRGGGNGVCLSKIRPEGDPVFGSTHAKACGPIEHMRMISEVMNSITQAGFRAMANMATMHVNHPDIINFIKCKQRERALKSLLKEDITTQYDELLKNNELNVLLDKFISNFNISVVASDKFMKAVENDEDWDLEFGGKIYQTVKAKELFDLIVFNAWRNGDPGLLFDDRVNDGPYKFSEQKINATNPCVVGETLIAVADGRVAVQISDLAESGADVPVYCRKPNGNVTIRIMRRPRLSGLQQKILKVTISNGHVMRVTENHKFVLSDGTTVEAKNLKVNDSLSILNRVEAPFEAMLKKWNSKSQNYAWLCTSSCKSWKLEHRMIYNFVNDKKISYSEGVIHHRDFNGLNNRPDNLELMSKREHDILHSKDMLGDKNPMRRAKYEWSEQKWEDYKFKMSQSTSGLKNGNAKQVSSEDIFQIAVKESQRLNRRMSVPEWRKLSAERNIVGQFTDFREDSLGTVSEFLRNAAIEAMVPGSEYDNAILREYKKFLSLKSDLNIFFNQGIKVQKNCEQCNKVFIVSYYQREISYCSIKCSNINHNKSDEMKYKVKKSKLRLLDQRRCRILSAYIDLEKSLNRQPLKQEFSSYCKEKKIPFRLPTKKEVASGRLLPIFHSWLDLQEQSKTFNHRVISVEENGYSDVYTGTVDDYHNYYIGHFEEKHNDKYRKFIYINNLQCGEQPLPEFGSCNLGSIDVSKFWSDDLKDVDWKSLATAIHTAVQFLDDVIDHNKFPTKEFEIWAKKNRPVGLGIMGWADLLLKKRIAYGSPRSIEFAEELAKFFEKEAHKKSVQLGKERGTPKCCNYKELDYRRNVTTISIAPTGSISLLAGCNSGIEPFYSTSIWIYNNTGTYQVQNEFADKAYFRSAVHEDESKQVTWQQHIDMQSAFQKYVDSGISKTINMPNSATIEDVYKAYMRAWQSGCKGITVYRDGSKTTQVLNTKAKGTIGSNVPNKRPKDVPCDIFKTRADGFDWHVIVGKVDDIPYEVFAVNGRVELPESGTVTKKKKRHYSLTDNDGNVLIDNLIEEEHRIHPKVSLESRRFSLELRHGIHPKYIVDQIDKSHDVMTSFSKACGRIMKNKYLDSVVVVDELCPYCVKNGKQVKVINESGCVHCSENCGYSKCG